MGFHQKAHRKDQEDPSRLREIVWQDDRALGEFRKLELPRLDYCFPEGTYRDRYVSG